MLWSVLRGRLLCSKLLRGEPVIPKSPSMRQRGFSIASLEKGGESSCWWLQSIACLQSLVSPGHLPGAVPSTYPRGCINGRGQGSGAGACPLGTISSWGCESQETSSLQACKANCCLSGVFPCRNPKLHGEGGPKVCWCGTVRLFSTVPGTSRIGHPGGSLSRRNAALHRGGNLCWVFGAGWHLQPSRSQLARGLEAPNANLPSPLPLFPTRPHAKDPLSAPPA